MAFAHFESAQPSGGALFSSGTVRNNFNSLYQGDLSPLRARAQDTPDLTVQVGGGLVENYYQQVWFNNNGTPSNYAGGNSPTIATPSVNPRIALLTLDRSGVLAWTYGAEAASPSAPNCPVNELPIAYVYERVGMTQIVNYEDRASYSSGGYLYRDIRPFMTPASAIEDVKSLLVEYDKDEDDYISKSELLKIISAWGSHYVSDNFLNIAVVVYKGLYKISELPDNLDLENYNVFSSYQDDKYNALFMGGKGTYFEKRLELQGGLKAYNSVSVPITYTSSNTLLDSSHCILLVGASGGEKTITLPDVSSSLMDGIVYIIKKIDSSGNAVVIDGYEAQPIDGAATISLTSQWETVRITCEGGEWYKI